MTGIFPEYGQYALELLRNFFKTSHEYSKTLHKHSNGLWHS